MHTIPLGWDLPHALPSGLFHKPVSHNILPSSSSGFWHQSAFLTYSFGSQIYTTLPFCNLYSWFHSFIQQNCLSVNAEAGFVQRSAFLELSVVVHFLFFLSSNRHSTSYILINFTSVATLSFTLPGLFAKRPPPQSTNTTRAWPCTSNTRMLFTAGLAIRTKTGCITYCSVCPSQRASLECR